jgi:hypothetical protein
MDGRGPRWSVLFDDEPSHHADGLHVESDRSSPTGLPQTSTEVKKQARFNKRTEAWVVLISSRKNVEPEAGIEPAT